MTSSCRRLLHLCGSRPVVSVHRFDQQRVNLVVVDSPAEKGRGVPQQLQLSDDGGGHDQLGEGPGLQACAGVGAVLAAETEVQSGSGQAWAWVLPVIAATPSGSCAGRG